MADPCASWKGYPEPAVQEWENLFPSPIKEMMAYCLTDKILNRRNGNIKFKNFKSRLALLRGICATFLHVVLLQCTVCVGTRWIILDGQGIFLIASGTGLCL